MTRVRLVMTVISHIFTFTWWFHVFTRNYVSTRSVRYLLRAKACLRAEHDPSWRNAYDKAYIQRYIFFYLRIQNFLQRWPKCTATYRGGFVTSPTDQFLDISAQVLLLSSTMNHCESLSHQLTARCWAPIAAENQSKGKRSETGETGERPCQPCTRMTCEQMIRGATAGIDLLARGRRSGEHQVALHSTDHPSVYHRQEKKKESRECCGRENVWEKGRERERERERRSEIVFRHY